MSKFHLLIVKFTSRTVRRDPPPHLQAMLRSAYLSKKLTSPIPTKDGGTLRTILKACEYMAAIGRPDVAAVSWQVRLAVLKDAELDVSKVPAK
jgi:hypothetical protein